MGNSEQALNKAAQAPDIGEVSGLLRAWSDEDRAALDRLTPIVYDELRRLACEARAPRSQPANNGLGERGLHATNRLQEHAVAESGPFLRGFVAVDEAHPGRHARRHNLKRRGGVQHVSLEETAVVGDDRAADLVALDDAMDALARIDHRKVQVVEMRFFGGLSVEETAEVLKVSPVTVMRDWSTAKAWLYRELTGGATDGL